MLDYYLNAITYIYQKKAAVFWRYNMFETRLTSKVVVQDILKLAKYGTFEWNLPKKLFKTKGTKTAWLKAFFSAKAYVGPRYIRVQSVNKDGLNKISKLLTEKLIDHTLHKYQPKQKTHSTVYMLTINKKEARKKYLQKIGFWHRKKQKNLAKTLNL